MRQTFGDLAGLVKKLFSLFAVFVIISKVGVTECVWLG